MVDLGEETMRRKIVISALIGVILLGASCGPSVPIPPAAITGDNSGGAIAVYQIWRMSDSYGQFYVQKISPEGDFLWGEKGVSVGSGYSDFGEFDSYAVSDGSGGAIVIWLEFLPRAEGELPSFQTHAARIDSEGDVEWQRDIPGVDQAIPDGSGGVIIAYRALYQDNISVLKIDGEGNLPWGQDGVSLNLSGYDSQRDIASDNSGGVIVVQQISGEGIICAQRVDSGGNILWQTGGVQACVGPAEGAQVVSDGAGGAIIAYMRDIPCEDGRIGYCDSDIYAQRIDAEGNVLWGPDGVPICVGPSAPNSPRIVTDGAGGAIIFFFFLDDYAAFRARRIDADGHELWEEEAELWGGIIVGDGSGGVISVWYSGEGTNAKAQRLDATGRELWGPDGTALTFRDLHSSLAVSDGCGGVLISWSAVEFTGSKASAVSYYVQRIDADGNLPWGDEGILLNP
jgi:hypothetical protein